MGFPHYQTIKVKWCLGRRQNFRIAYCQCFKIFLLLLCWVWILLHLQVFLHINESKEKSLRGINEAEWKGFFSNNHVPSLCFWKLFLSLSFYYPQVPEILFDGRQLHPTAVDKPWKTASDNHALERCICNGYFQCKKNHCSKVRALAQLLLSDILIFAWKGI